MGPDREQEQLQIEDETSVDIEAAAAEIGSDLFEQQADKDEDTTEGQERSDDTEASGEVVEPPADAENPDAEKVETEGERTEEQANSEAVQDTGAPKTWTKDALAKWATIDPVVQQEILKREQDFHNGIAQYKTQAELGQRYDAVVAPYKATLDAENVDPVQLFNGFAANHYLLSKGTNEQKVQIAAHLVEHYKIPMGELLEFMGEREEVPEHYKKLEQEVAQLRGEVTSRQTAEKTEIQKRVDEEVNAFVNDPKNIYFEELAQDIQQLFEKGMAKSMPEAYEKALWSNPSTRAKETERLREAAAAEAAEAEKARLKEKAKAQGDHVKVKPNQRDGTVVTAGSIDDTLEETMRQIAARGGNE